MTAFEPADNAPAPTAFVAVTVNVWAVPFVSPVTVAVVAPVVLVVLPPGVAVTVYPLTAKPPLLTGAAQDKVAWAIPATAETPVGEPGTVAGVTVLDRAEKIPVPSSLVAWTWNLTAVPLTSPVTFRLVAPAGAERAAPRAVPVASVGCTV